MQELINNIKEWVKLDNEIQQLKTEEMKRKKSQKEISKYIMNQMKESEIDEFNLKEGTLKYSRKTVKQPLTKKTLANILTKYYNGNIDEANELNNFILSNREEKVVEKLTHAT
jgi:hypothetical protein